MNYDCLNFFPKESFEHMTLNKHGVSFHHLLHDHCDLTATQNQCQVSDLQIPLTPGVFLNFRTFALKKDVISQSKVFLRDNIIFNRLQRQKVNMLISQVCVSRQRRFLVVANAESFKMFLVTIFCCCDFFFVSTLFSLTFHYISNLAYSKMFIMSYPSPKFINFHTKTL